MVSSEENASITTRRSTGAANARWFSGLDCSNFWYFVPCWKSYRAGALRLQDTCMGKIRKDICSLLVRALCFQVNFVQSVLVAELIPGLWGPKKELRTFVGWVYGKSLCSSQHATCTPKTIQRSNSNIYFRFLVQRSSNFNGRAPTSNMDHGYQGVGTPIPMQCHATVHGACGACRACVSSVLLAGWCPARCRLLIPAPAL